MSLWLFSFPASSLLSRRDDDSDKSSKSGHAERRYPRLRSECDLRASERAAVPSALRTLATFIQVLNPAVGWQDTSMPARHSHCSGMRIRPRTPLVQLQATAELQSLRDLKVYELKAICRAKGLKVTGRKDELIGRIENSPAGGQRQSARQTPRQPRPKNAWMLFMAKYREEHATEAMKATQIASAAGATWRAMSEEDKAPFLAEAARLKQEYDLGTESPAPAESPRPSTGRDVGVNVVDIPDNRVSAVEVVDADYEDVSTVEVVGPEITHAEVEIVSEEDFETTLVEKRRERRSAERKARLAKYFSEEYTKVQSQLEKAAGAPYVEAFDNSGVESISLLGTEVTYRRESKSNQPAPAVGPTMQGYRLAWCHSFDARTGVGTIVDLEREGEIQVSRQALKTSDMVLVEQRQLFPGEFVQYDPSAQNGEAWVQGVSGWPLMCQTCAEMGVPDPFST